MEGSRFDALTTFVASRPSRRRLLRALAGGLLAPLTGQAAAAQAGCAGALRACLAQAREDLATARQACQARPPVERRSCLAAAGATKQAADDACDAAFGRCQTPGTCQPAGAGCADSGQCCSGLICGADGTCQGLLGGGLCSLGPGCAHDADCGAGRVCRHSQCFQTCDPAVGCSQACTNCACDHSNRDSTTVCVDLAHGGSGCIDDSECSLGQICSQISSSPLAYSCTPPCPR